MKRGRGTPIRMRVTTDDWIKFKGRQLVGEFNSPGELASLVESVRMVIEEPEYHRDVFSGILACSPGYKHLDEQERYALWEKKQ